MFHVPISAPTARRMNTAPSAEETPPIAALADAAPLWPFLNATSPATSALVEQRDLQRPAVASVPNSDDRQADQPDQGDDRDERVEQRRLADPDASSASTGTVVSSADCHAAVGATAIGGDAPERSGDRSGRRGRDAAR